MPVFPPPLRTAEAIPTISFSRPSYWDSEREFKTGTYSFDCLLAPSLRLQPHDHRGKGLVGKRDSALATLSHFIPAFAYTPPFSPLPPNVSQPIPSHPRHPTHPQVPSPNPPAPATTVSLLPLLTHDKKNKKNHIKPALCFSGSRGFLTHGE